MVLSCVRLPLNELGPFGVLLFTNTNERINETWMVGVPPPVHNGDSFSLKVLFGSLFESWVIIRDTACISLIPSVGRRHHAILPHHQTTRPIPVGPLPLLFITTTSAPPPALILRLVDLVGPPLILSALISTK